MEELLGKAHQSAMVILKLIEAKNDNEAVVSDAATTNIRSSKTFLSQLLQLSVCGPT